MEKSLHAITSELSTVRDRLESVDNGVVLCIGYTGVGKSTTISELVQLDLSVVKDLPPISQTVVYRMHLSRLLKYCRMVLLCKQK